MTNIALSILGGMSGQSPAEWIFQNILLVAVPIEQVCKWMPTIPACLG